MYVNRSDHVTRWGYKSYRDEENLGKKYDIDTKTHSTGSVSALDVRNLSQWYQKTIPMLRLIPQLLRRSEIQLFEGQAPPFKGFPLYSLRNPYYILT